LPEVDVAFHENPDDWPGHRRRNGLQREVHRTSLPIQPIPRAFLLTIPLSGSTLEALQQTVG